MKKLSTFLHANGNAVMKFFLISLTLFSITLVISCTEESLIPTGPISSQSGLRVSATGSDNTGEGTNENPFATIQYALDMAVEGDTVWVAPGSYVGDGNRNIDFKGKGVALISEQGPAVTIIDGQSTRNDPHRGFYFGSDEGPTTVVAGFTITNCVASQYSHGGGMWGHGSPTLSPTIVGNIITNCGAGRGGGILFQDGATPTIINNTIVGNYAYTTVNGGLQQDGGIIKNNIIRDNTPAVNLHAGGAIVEYNNIQNGPTGNGNIDVDPLFVDQATGDFGLQEGSPCIDAGDPNPIYNGLDGTRADIGAIPLFQISWDDDELNGNDGFLMPNGKQHKENCGCHICKAIRLNQCDDGQNGFLMPNGKYHKANCV
ncbi:MAG: DUF1565 domain-containing protein, partial [Bacteroidota bacterium]|nr:DUF1565 domain-containing protein [Bacteroidota bacterium]